MPQKYWSSISRLGYVRRKGKTAPLTDLANNNAGNNANLAQVSHVASLALLKNKSK